MERRYSLSNSPRLSKPMADSTWIDGMPARQRTAAQQLHTNLGSRERSNSSICLSNSYTNGSPQHRSLHQLSRTSTSVSKMTRQRLNLSQLDPKTFADVHSSGLASRIVEYQRESGRGLQRSISFNNVYNPFTQPRRSSIAVSPLCHKPSLPSVSMTRIAPPERSFYCGNTLPSLLRSNSLLGVEKVSDQLSRENRPIMHPPPLQHESEPTRSVLEELKEISRKRINSGEIQPNEYNSKKSCNRMADYVDHHHQQQQQHHRQHHQQHHQQQHHQQHHQQFHPHHQMSMLQPQSGFKRQRELTVSVPLRLHHPPIALPQHQHPHQALHMPAHHFAASVSPQQSPEQLAKRRNCSYSNDIASSLSSSKLHSNKRKLYDKRATSNTSTNNANASSGSNSSGSSETSPRQQAAKIQRNQQPSTVDLRLEHLSRTQSTPITALPVTAAQRTVSAPVVQTRHEPAKPKLTLFNAQQRQQQQQERQLEQDLDSPDVDANEYAGIQFVKPKQQHTLGASKNSHLERTQKTKLALMLSSLRGEIYQDETAADEADAMPVKATVAAAPATTTATVTGVTTTTTTTKPTSSEPSKIFSFGNNTTTPAATPIFGSASASAATPIFGSGPAATTTPIFGSAAASTATPVFGSATATTAQPAFSFGGAATPAAAAETAAPSAANSSNLFAFGGANKPVAKATPFTLPNKASSNGGSSVFSFGGGNGDGPKMGATATTAGSAPSAANSFSFNSTTATAAAPAAATNTFSFNATAKQTPIFGSNNATESKPFAFGGNAGAQQQDQQPQQTTSATAAAGAQTQQQQQAGGFSFAAVAQKSETTNLFSSPAASTGVVKPSFNFGGNTGPSTASGAAGTASAPANGLGAFAAPAQPANSPPNLFTFGGNATTNNAPTAGGNLFANAVAAAQNHQQQAKPGGFSFSANNSNNAAAPAGNANTPFAFGGITSTPQSSNVAKPFTFGNPTASNIFGSPSTTAAATNGGANNFGGAATPTSAPGMPGTPQQMNPFAPPSTPESRPIRRATRRLKK
ncbi:uncharacterized protein Dvir_GJ10887 [Drosophila virilis]|uniref:Uncharacterized protein n=1 Tax=Drosophila virilis TaxID=7244 RepID=B4M473_DROVI|nr:uncharacterized protein Dvir_GJ10887 [Drosophila virilis]